MHSAFFFVFSYHLLSPLFSFFGFWLIIFFLYHVKIIVYICILKHLVHQVSFIDVKNCKRIRESGSFFYC